MCDYGAAGIINSQTNVFLKRLFIKGLRSAIYK